MTKLLLVMALLLPAQAWAKLAVVTTVPDLASIVREVGGDEVSVEAISKGTQDPHSIEAKPSFMTRVAKADLVVAVGLDLETAWLGSILRGGRNPKTMPGAAGYLEVGPQVDPLEVPSGKISRAEGDVHPYGNPHVTLDPIRAGKIAVLIGTKLAELDSAHAEQFRKRAAELQARLEKKSAEWKKRIEKSGVSKVVTYHRTLNYFLDRFRVTPVAVLEPKPGIPPTSGHILGVIGQIREQKVPLVLVENYFDPSITRKIVQEVPGLKTQTVPVSVEGEPGVTSLEALYERLVAAVESAATATAPAPKASARGPS